MRALPCAGSPGSGPRSWCPARRRRIAVMVWAKCPAPPSSRSSRSTEVTTTCFSPSLATAARHVGRLEGIERARAGRSPRCRRLQARVQVSPMIIMVACFLAQHSPMLGQAASSQTVCRPCSRARSACRVSLIDLGDRRLDPDPRGLALDRVVRLVRLLRVTRAAARQAIGQVRSQSHQSRSG